MANNQGYQAGAVNFTGQSGAAMVAVGGWNGASFIAPQTIFPTAIGNVLAVTAANTWGLTPQSTVPMTQNAAAAVSVTANTRVQLTNATGTTVVTLPLSAAMLLGNIIEITATGAPFTLTINSGQTFCIPNQGSFLTSTTIAATTVQGYCNSFGDILRITKLGNQGAQADGSFMLTGATVGINT